MESGNSYVIRGWLTTDPLEKAFWKLLQGSSGAYFITAEPVIEKVRIDCAKLALRKNLDIDSCQHCDRELKQGKCKIIDNLFDLDKNLSKETISSLVYIAGYV